MTAATGTLHRRKANASTAPTHPRGPRRRGVRHRHRADARLAGGILGCGQLRGDGRRLDPLRPSPSPMPAPSPGQPTVSNPTPLSADGRRFGRVQIGSKFGPARTNQDPLKPSNHGPFRPRPTPVPWLWSRRSRVQVPSLTPCSSGRFQPSGFRGAAGEVPMGYRFLRGEGGSHPA